jgi:hypothetical protein
MFTKHAPKLLVLLLGLLIGGGLLAAKAPAEPKQYSYVSLLQINNYLYISNGAAFEEISVKGKKNKIDFDFAPLFEKVNEFEAQGYELMQNTVHSPEVQASIRNYVLMRRPK